MSGNPTAVCQPKVLSVSLRCDLTDVRPSIQAVRDFLAKNGWQENDLMSFDLALVEACNNAIKYSGPAGSSQPITLEAVCDDSHVEFRLHDHTPGFDWPRIIRLPEPECESGRGLYLITSLMDDAGYFRGQGENFLVMRKARPKSTIADVTARFNSFSDFLAIQMANNRLREENVGERLVSHELEIARNIQLSLLPASLPQLPNFSLAAFCHSAHEVGGDFYDVIEIDANSRLLVIADVMGKGIPAAMFASILRALVRASPELAREPAGLLARVNRLLFPDLSAVDMFITAQVAYVDAEAATIITASAGHCPVLVATSTKIKAFSPEGMPLGIVRDAVFQPQTMGLASNCRILLYTDGVTDALNFNNEFFGQQRLKDWLWRTMSAPVTAEQLRDELSQELADHQTNTAMNDDQTFLILAG